ncbi:hypothetical protein K8I31_16070, partial [bacterium]|nr:hypothetical protein [bacterium]
PLSFKIKMVEQEVIVASGTYKFQRTPFHTSSNQDAILIYANKPNYKSKTIEIGTFSDLVQFLRKRTALEIIDETDSSTKRIYWQVMQQPFYAGDDMNYEILNTISKQSGFIFKKEMRMLPVLTIIQKKE